MSKNSLQFLTLSRATGKPVIFIASDLKWGAYLRAVFLKVGREKNCFL